MYTVRVAAATRNPSASCRRKPVGPAQRDRHPDARRRSHPGRDGARSARGRRGARTSRSRRRHAEPRRHRHPRERRQPLPALAAGFVCLARRHAGPRRRKPPRHRHLGPIGARGGGAGDRAGAGACRRRPERESILDCGEFTLDEAARARGPRRRSTSAATADRCTSPRRATVPIVGLYGPTLPVRSAPWRASTWPSEAAEVDGLPCRPCDQRTACPEISAV